MRFTLWGPKNKKAIVRIYIEGSDAYFDRRGIHSPIKINDCPQWLADKIFIFLHSNDIDVSQLPTRRHLAREMYAKGLLVGNWYKYSDSFLGELPDVQNERVDFGSICDIDKTLSKTAGVVVSMSDFIKRRDRKK